MDFYGWKLVLQGGQTPRKLVLLRGQTPWIFVEQRVNKGDRPV